MEWYKKKDCTHSYYKVSIYKCYMCDTYKSCHFCVFTYRNKYACYDCFKKLTFINMLSGIYDSERKYKALFPPA